MVHQLTTDPILDVFQDFRLTQSRYVTSTLTAPWGMEILGCGRALFHFVVEGACVMRFDDTTYALDSGDFILLPHGAKHDLLDDVHSEVRSFSSLPGETISALGYTLRYGGGGARTVLISGNFAFEPHPVVAELPRTIIMRRTEMGESNYTAGLVASLMEEVTTVRPGSETVVNRLTDVFVIRAIRKWLGAVTQEQPGWLGALCHSGLGRALALIHTHATRPWTVESLAAEAGMSRASFAKKFGEQLGTSPMQFLSLRRMQLATRWLRDDAMTISEVSYRLGYSSKAAFSRAFKRYTGSTPGKIIRKPPDQAEDNVERKRV